MVREGATMVKQWSSKHENNQAFEQVSKQAKPHRLHNSPHSSKSASRQSLTDSTIAQSGKLSARDSLSKGLRSSCMEMWLRLPHMLSRMCRGHFSRGRTEAVRRSGPAGIAQSAAPSC